MYYQYIAAKVQKNLNICKRNSQFVSEKFSKWVKKILKVLQLVFHIPNFIHFRLLRFR